MSTVNDRSLDEKHIAAAPFSEAQQVQGTTTIPVIISIAVLFIVNSPSKFMTLPKMVQCLSP